MRKNVPNLEGYLAAERVGGKLQVADWPAEPRRRC
jgi:hypothetical protein